MPHRSPPRARNAIGLLAAVAFVLGPTLAWLRVVPALTGFAIFALGGLAALLTAVGSLVQAVRGRGFGRGGMLATAVGAAFVTLAAQGRGLPRINDFTTDLRDPPAFRHAQLQPANVGRDLSYPRDFAAVQEGCCADLEPARLPLPPEDAFARARAVADAMPDWRLTSVEPESGTIEAIATTRLFGFEDDVVIRVRPDGAGSRVDVRSKSRDGKGDVGANAARIRAYLGRLQTNGAVRR